jgi:tRNA G10  N-methylase Trm11
MAKVDLVCADTNVWIKKQFDKSFDAIITDYVYGAVFPMEDFIRVCKGNIITFCASEDEPFKPDERAYWIKTPSTKNYVKNLGRFVEKIYIYKAGGTFNQLHWSQMTGVYNDLVIEREGHQWRKPLSLIERLVRIYTNKGDRVLDPYCGSGTTMSACMNLNRNFTGVDIDPTWVDYCKIARNEVRNVSNDGL